MKVYDNEVKIWKSQIIWLIFDRQVPAYLDSADLIDLKTTTYLFTLYHDKIFENLFFNQEFRVLFN